MEINLERSSLLSEGWHSFMVDNVDFGEGANGTYLKLTCVTLDKQHTLFYYLSLSPAARWKLDEFLDSIHAPLTGKMKAQQFIGKKFRGFVKHEEFEGKLRPKLVSTAPDPSGSGTASTPVVESIVVGLPSDVTSVSLPEESSPTNSSSTSEKDLPDDEDLIQLSMPF